MATPATLTVVFDAPSRKYLKLYSGRVDFPGEIFGRKKDEGPTWVLTDAERDDQASQQQPLWSVPYGGRWYVAWFLNDSDVSDARDCAYEKFEAYARNTFAKKNAPWNNNVVIHAHQGPDSKKCVVVLQTDGPLPDSIGGVDEADVTPVKGTGLGVINIGLEVQSGHRLLLITESRSGSE